MPPVGDLNRSRQGVADVFVLAGRIPELYLAILGALKARCVVCPLFSAFGPEPISQVTAPMMEGELALKAGWPSMMRAQPTDMLNAPPCGL